MAAGVGDDRAPADHLRGAAERLGGVDGADHEQARRRPEDLREDLTAVPEVEELVPPGPQDLVEAGHGLVGPAADPLAGLGDEELRAEPVALDDREEHRALVGLDDALEAVEELLVRRVHEHVDLAAAGQPDGERELVRDPVLEELRLRAVEHLARVAEDLVLDTAARDGAGHLAALGDGELRADRARRRLPGRDHGRERDPLPARPPALDVGREPPSRRVPPLDPGHDVRQLLEARQIVPGEEAVDVREARRASRPRAAGSPDVPSAG